MSHTEPTSMPFDDAMLSAYLDDELTADQRARVEAHLADNSTSRQLLDELRALARVLKKLPKETLDPGFSAAVMAAIDHAAVGKPAPVQRSEPRVEVAERPPGWLRGRDRSWAWLAAAIATALLVMFLSGEKPGQQRDIAKLEDAETENERLAETEHTPEASEDNAAPDLAGSAPLSDDGEGLSPVLRRAAPPRGGASLAPGRAGSVRDQSSHSTREHTDDDGVRESHFASNAAEVLQRIVERGEGKAEPEKLIDELERYTPPSEPVVLVVQVDPSPNAVETQAFDTVLMNNGIMFTSIRTLEELAVPSEPAIEEYARKPAEGRVRDNKGLVARAEILVAEKYDAVVVEATPEQIHAVMKELNADSGTWLGVKIQSNEQTPESQRQWSQYVRQQATLSTKPRVDFGEELADLKTPTENKERGAVVQPAPPVPTGDARQVGRAVRVRLGDEASRYRSSDQRFAGTGQSRGQVVAEGTGRGSSGRGGDRGRGGYGGQEPAPESPSGAVDQRAEKQSAADEQALLSDKPESLGTGAGIGQGVAPKQVRAVFLFRAMPAAAASTDPLPR